jgi:hypothetical protein
VPGDCCQGQARLVTHHLLLLFLLFLSLPHLLIFHNHLLLLLLLLLPGAVHGPQPHTRVVTGRHQGTHVTRVPRHRRHFGAMARQLQGGRGRSVQLQHIQQGRWLVTVCC